MSPTLARPRLAPPKNIGGSLMVSAGVAAVVVVAVVLLPGMRLPTYVSRLSVTNPTLYGVEVDVTSAERDGWLGLGGFPPETTRAANESSTRAATGSSGSATAARRSGRWR